MIDTNALLAFAFSIISSFTNVVYVPPEAVPQSKDDLEVCIIGRSFFPLDVYLKGRRGTQFWIANGVVEQYYSPDMYFGLQDPNRIPEFVGTAKLSSNLVFELANRTIQGLVRSGNPLTNVTPRVTVAKPYLGQPVPSYDITWPLPENPQVFSIARMGIDARYGRVVSVSLHDPGFYDMARFQQNSNQVYKAEVLKNSPPLETNTPVGRSTTRDRR